MPAPTLEGVLPSLAGEGVDPVEWMRFQARHSRSFSFASRWMPDDLARPIAGIYAYCRLTDDLVDRADEGVDRGALLEQWRDASRRAWGGEAVGHGMLEHVLSDSAEHGVSFEHVEGLIDGVAMDLEPRDYEDMRALRRYTRGVAGSVGGWLTERVGVRDDGVVERAYELGHALQITNIVRDVGEDLERGRCYLPVDAMRRHGLARGDLEAARRAGAIDGTGALPDGYGALMDEMMAAADESYDTALEAVVALPGTFSRAAIIAARVYQGIHAALRRAGHDSLHRRVHTRRLEKATLAAGALAELARMDRVRNRHARRVAARRA